MSNVYRYESTPALHRMLKRELRRKERLLKAGIASLALEHHYVAEDIAQEITRRQEQQ